MNIKSYLAVMANPTAAAAIINVQTQLTQRLPIGSIHPGQPSWEVKIVGELYCGTHNHSIPLTLGPQIITQPTEADIIRAIGRLQVWMHQCLWILWSLDQ